MDICLVTSCVVRVCELGVRPGDFIGERARRGGAAAVPVRAGSRESDRNFGAEETREFWCVSVSLAES